MRAHRLGTIGVALLLALGLMAARASATITDAGTGNYPYTQGTAATFWFDVEPHTSDGGDAVTGYFVCYEVTQYTSWANADAGKNGTVVVDGVDHYAPGASGCSNEWTGVPIPSEQEYDHITGATPGDVYVGCARGYEYIDDDGTYYFGPIPDTTSVWCEKATQMMGSVKPSGTATLDGGATYTNSTTLAAHITYADSYSPPFQGASYYGSNFDCLGQGASCTPTIDASHYDSGCSQGGTSGATTATFDCSIDLTKVSGLSLTDGTYDYCVVEDDDSVPDAGTSEPYGVSGGVSPTNFTTYRTPTECDSVILDRTPPSVTPSANPTTIAPGQSVTFGVSTSDGGSGTTGTPTWNFGDGSAAGSGTAPSHTFATAGTYTVTASIADKAGNTGSGTITIHVVAPTSSLAVSKAGTGSGTVTSSPGGINCGAACSAPFTSGSHVTLSADAAVGSTFAGWSGGGCSGSGSCSVTLSANTTVTATFAKQTTGTTTTTTTTTSTSHGATGGGGSGGGTGGGTTTTTTTSGSHGSGPSAPKITGFRHSVSARHRTSSFSWGVSQHRVRSSCALVKLPKRGKTPKPHYGKCTSPKVYRHLAHGRYTFFVEPAGGKAVSYTFRL